MQDRLLSSHDTWALAHIAQFPTMSLQEQEVLLGTLSPEGARLARIMLNTLQERPDESSDGEDPDLKVIRRFMNWAQSLGQRAGPRLVRTAAPI